MRKTLATIFAVAGLAIGGSVVAFASPSVPAATGPNSHPNVSSGQSTADEGQNGTQETGTAGESTADQGQDGAQETGTAGESTADDGQNGTQEKETAGQSTKDEGQVGPQESGTSGQSD